MRKKTLTISILLILLLMPPKSGWTAEGNKAAAFAGQDLHLEGQDPISYLLSSTDHVLVFRNGFSMSIDAQEFSADTAVVWLWPDSEWIPESDIAESSSRARIDYQVIVYLQGNLSGEKPKSVATIDMSRFLSSSQEPVW